MTATLLVNFTVDPDHYPCLFVIPRLLRGQSFDNPIDAAAPSARGAATRLAIEQNARRAPSARPLADKSRRWRRGNRRNSTFIP